MIKKKEENQTIEIDLTGPNGNAFYLLGMVGNLSKKLGLNENEIKTEMKSGDYENLVNVFDKYFGSIVILYR